MGLRFETSVPALNASRLLTASDRELTHWLERLSSGLCIDRASDVAEGLGLAVNILSRVRDVASPRHVAHGETGLAQDAEGLAASRSKLEGALNETTTILQRIRALAVQASHDTADADNGPAIDGKVSQLRNELDAIDPGSGTESLSSLASAICAISMIDTAIKSVASISGSLDAYQTRLEFTINTLAIQQENSTAAGSAIRDAGIAAETIAFTQSTILASAASSVRAQANVLSQAAQALLGIGKV